MTPQACQDAAPTGVDKIKDLLCPQEGPPLTGLNEAGATVSDVEELLDVRKDAWEEEDSGCAGRGRPTFGNPLPSPLLTFSLKSVPATVKRSM